MENQKINQQFREDEIANIRRWDKERNEYVTNPFPKIGGTAPTGSRSKRSPVN